MRQWLTLREAARYIGEGDDEPAARRVLRDLQRRERRPGVGKLLRRKGTGSQRRYLVREDTLRQQFRERFQEPYELEAAIGAGVRRVLEEVRDEQERCQVQINALAAAILRIERRLGMPPRA